MPHPYPRHQSHLPYIGKHHYFLTFCTEQRRPFFEDDDTVALVRTQILRACRQHDFELTAYSFMPDHLHLVARGVSDTSDCKAFVKSAKQYAGYTFSQHHGCRLFQRYCFERVIRDDMELALTIGYVVSNPVAAGLVAHPKDYPHQGSQCYSMDELLQICEYREGTVYRAPASA